MSQSKTWRQRVAVLLVGWSSAACASRPDAVPVMFKLTVRFVEPSGQLVPGGWVRWAEGREVAERGAVEISLPFRQHGQWISAECPLLHSGPLEKRYLSGEALSAGGAFSLEVVCPPHQRSWGLSIHSECASAELFLDGRPLGRAHQGWYQAWITETTGAIRAQEDRHLLVRARSDDPTCMFLDPVHQRPTPELEVSAELSDTSRAAWAHFPRLPAPRRPASAKKRPARPYRL